MAAWDGDSYGLLLIDSNFYILRYKMDLTKDDAATAIQMIQERAKNLNVDHLSNFALDYQNFTTCSGAPYERYHHYGDRGLVIHTFEVIEACFGMSTSFIEYNVDPVELFLSALFHDIGKTHDYMQDDDGKWVPTPHRRLIGHISKGVEIWHRAVIRWGSVGFIAKYKDNVTHAILSHHGCREWGSPVGPKRRAAIILHHADSVSARLHDCDTLDRFAGKG